MTLLRIWLARLCRWMAWRRLDQAEQWGARADWLEARVAADMQKVRGIGA